MNVWKKHKFKIHIAIYVMRKNEFFKINITLSWAGAKQIAGDSKRDTRWWKVAIHTLKILFSHEDSN